MVILIDIIEQASLQVPPEVKAADGLTSYAVQARYPGWGEEVTEEEYRRALELAQRVVSWAESILRGKDR